jgi:aconitate hydratase
MFGASKFHSLGVGSASPGSAFLNGDLNVPSLDSFKCRKSLTAAGKSYDFYSLKAAEAAGLGDISRLPGSMKVLLENLLRHEDGRSVTRNDIKAIAKWLKTRRSTREIAYRPARVLMQDFTGVPAVVDLAAMREAMTRLGGEPDKINPLSPVDLVIDHSVMVDFFAGPGAFRKNVQLEYERNGERYAFLRWGQTAFDNFRVVPPGTGICHQVNLENLAQVVWTSREDAPPATGRKAPARTLAYPDTLVGTDSHTTMVNGLSVLGWGVGGIEAEAAMLGQPISMLIPEVVGMRLKGRLKEGTTATDLVLTVTQILRKKGVVNKFVEFFGPGLADLSLADRATIANMAPEYGATCGFFPIDAETIRYLKATGRTPARVALVEKYAKAQGLWRDAKSPEPAFTETLELDISTVEASLAGPKRPQDRVPLSQAAATFRKDLTETFARRSANESRISVRGTDYDLGDGDVVIAAITSCTNTSNPSVMLGAGLIARNAVKRGLTVKPWVKTSLAPGSQVVSDYLKKAGLQAYLDKLGFNLVGYGCTTCIGNSGPLPDPIATPSRRQPGGGPSFRQPNSRADSSAGQASYLASPLVALCCRLAAQGPAARAVWPGPEGQDVYLLTSGRAREIAEVAQQRLGSHVPRPTPTCSRATTCGRGSAGPAAAPTPGMKPAPTCACRRTSSAWPESQPPSRTSRVRASWPSSAIPSPPTTSRPRARSPRTARPAAT